MSTTIFVTQVAIEVYNPEIRVLLIIQILPQRSDLYFTFLITIRHWLSSRLQDSTFFMKYMKSFINK